MTEIVKAGGALAIRADQTEWTAQQAAVLRQSGISDDVTAAELAGFLHLCQRTGLDPFSRQIYLIGRKDKKAGRVVYTPQTGIDGYRVVARRATVKSGGTYGYEDTLWCDKSGQWRDVWLSDEPPAAVKVTVLRDGQRYSAVALFREYVQTGWENKPIGMWGKMPASQLAKCAEALALRKAFPHDLAGVYTAEEMAQADNPVSEERHLRSVRRGGTDQWATPAVQTAVADLPPESLTPAGRDYMREAHAAPDAATVRRIWQDAKTEGAVPEYLAQIAEVGRQKAAAEQAAEAADEVVEGEVVPDAAEDEAAAAERELRAWATGVGLPDIARDFESAKGLPLDQATAGEIRAFHAELTGNAA